MHPYAQTNIQLFNQLRHDGYSTEDLECLFKAYALAMHLFTGRFRGSGKTFIAHLVGTASILASLRASITVVTAGMLHAAYAHGDFGAGGRRMSSAKRNELRRVIGQQAEEYIAQYTAQSWNEQTIFSTYDRLDALSPFEQSVLLIHLANELEDHLDLGMLYCSKQRQGDLTSSGALQVKMAERLGFATLAADLAQAFQDGASADVPPQLRRPNHFSFTLVPRSYQRRLPAAFRHRFAQVLRRLRAGRR